MCSSRCGSGLKGQDLGVRRSRRWWSVFTAPLILNPKPLNPNSANRKPPELRDLDLGVRFRDRSRAVGPILKAHHETHAAEL